MRREDFFAGDKRHVPQRSVALAGVMVRVLLTVALTSSAGLVRGAQEDSRGAKAVSYHNDNVPEGPWSVHVIKFDRTNSDYTLQTTLASGTVRGMVTLSEQVRAVRPELGRPVAAINGDFYYTRPRAYYGDPQGLQISEGELISGPTDHACFWLDAAGKPHTAVVQSLFRVTWPGGSTSPLGLNENRPGDGAVLYTPTMGPSTGTKSGGREIVLEAADKQAWLPLRVGAKVQGKVVEIRDAADTPLKPGMMVLSLGPQLLVDAPILKAGDLVQISTATTPDLTGSQTAIGGGPRLLADGKVVEGWKSPNQRHPRTAVGWNDQYLFLVLVDGRQPGRSVGMSYVELAAYFQKLGCTHALNLDGGGSASMWAFGQVVSNPSEGKERPVANGLVLVKKVKKNGN